MDGSVGNVTCIAKQESTIQSEMSADCIKAELHIGACVQQVFSLTSFLYPYAGHIADQCRRLSRCQGNGHVVLKIMSVA